MGSRMVAPRRTRDPRSAQEARRLMIDEPQAAQDRVYRTPESEDGSPIPPSFAPTPDVRPGFTNGSDMGERFTNDRARIAGMGDMLDRDFQNDRASSGFWRDYYRGGANSAYGEIAEGRGGYRPDEQEQIIGRGELDSLQMTPEERQSLFMNEGEFNATSGDPYRAEQWFDPAWQDQINTERNADLRRTAGEYGSRMRETVNPDALRTDRNYESNIRGILDQGDAAAAGALTGTEGAVRGAIDPTRLRQSEGFADSYRLTPEQQRDMVTATGMDVGYMGRVNADRVRRAAQSSGYGSPAALATGLGRLQNESNADAGDAMFRARIGANSEAARREMDIESNRQGAERDYAGMRSGAELDLGARRLSDSRAGADRRYDATRDIEGQRVSNERDITGRQTDIEDRVGNMNYDTADRTGANTQENARYIGETGAALARGTDDRQVDRARDNRDNRQSNERYAQEQRYARGIDRNDRLSQRTAGVADARRDDEREYRGFNTGMFGQESQNYQAANQNRLGAFGTTTSGTNTSSANAAEFDMFNRRNGGWNAFKTGLGSSLGSTIGGTLGGRAGKIGSGQPRAGG